LQEYYKFKAVDGSVEEAFNLAYRIPGLNKILQAAGRLHRSANDKGIIFLLGERFSSDYYKNFFPEFLKPISITTSNFVESEIKNFWAKF
jgi:Rad3-related DNA helicase